MIGPIPSQVVNDSASTPISGTTPNARKKRNAGSAIQVRTRLRAPPPDGPGRGGGLEVGERGERGHLPMT